MRVLNTLITFILYLKVKIYQLQVPENKNQLLIFMLAITPVQLCQEHNSEPHICVCTCFYACVRICIPTY